MKKLTIVKVGGNVLEHKPHLHSFLHSFLQIDGDKWLVHGGGKRSTVLAEKLGIDNTFVDGRRVTSLDFLQLAIDTYSGLNKNLVAALQANGQAAIGLSGADLNCVPSRKRNPTPINYGMVGDPTDEPMDEKLVHFLLENNIVAVFSALSFDNIVGSLLNTNADTIAQTIAVKLSNRTTVELIFAFEKAGVMRNINDDSSLISNLTETSITELKAQQVIVDGMIPKIDNALKALKAGVNTVRITSFDTLHAGTLIKL